MSPDRIKQIRQKTGLKQDDFSRTYFISLSSVRNWEQGRFAPDALGESLLMLIEDNPVRVATVIQRSQ